VQDLQNIIKSRGSGSSVSLFESFKQQAQEAAKIPAEILKAPTEALKPAPEAPAIPLPITKALPQPTSKAAAGSAPVHVAMHIPIQSYFCHLYINQIHTVLTISDVLPNGSAQCISSLSLLFGTCPRLFGSNGSSCGCVGNKFVLARMLQEYGLLKEAAQSFFFTPVSSTAACDIEIFHYTN